jgi:ABC-type polysaccharide/polyol phosphate export permease
MAFIHLKLWNDGYRSVPWIGPLFMANAVLGALAAIAVLVAPLRLLPWAALLGGLLEIGTLLGLVLSLTVGLLGFHESWGGLVLPSILVEAAGFVVLAGYGASVLLPQLRDRRAAR